MITILCVQIMILDNHDVIFHNFSNLFNQYVVDMGAKNPNWPEITNELFANQLAADRHNVVSRVFQLKLN